MAQGRGAATATLHMIPPTPNQIPQTNCPRCVPQAQRGQFASIGCRPPFYAGRPAAPFEIYCILWLFICTSFMFSVSANLLTCAKGYAKLNPLPKYFDQMQRRGKTGSWSAYRELPDGARQCGWSRLLAPEQPGSTGIRLSKPGRKPTVTRAAIRRASGRSC